MGGGGRGGSAFDLKRQPPGNAEPGGMLGTQ